MKHPKMLIAILAITFFLAALGPPGTAATPDHTASSQLLAYHAPAPPAIAIDAVGFEAQHPVLTVHTIHVNDVALEVDSIYVPVTPSLINEGYITHNADLIEGITILPYSPLIATINPESSRYTPQYSTWSWTIGHWC